MSTEFISLTGYSPPTDNGLGRGRCSLPLRAETSECHLQFCLVSTKHIAMGSRESRHRSKPCYLCSFRCNYYILLVSVLGLGGLFLGYSENSRFWEESTQFRIGNGGEEFLVDKSRSYGYPNHAAMKGCFSNSIPSTRTVPSRSTWKFLL
jgi:hypothetical protein